MWRKLDFFKISFLMWKLIFFILGCENHFFKSLLSLLQNCFCLVFLVLCFLLFLAGRHSGILLPDQGLNPHPLHRKVKCNH